MDLSKLFEQALGLGHAAFAKAADVVGAGVGYVRETVGSIELFGSTEASDTYGAQKFDEKHYFLVPYRPAVDDYSLYSMRCLPDGVPPVNDLPKRRVLHVPSAAGREVVENILAAEARASAEAAGLEEGTFGDRLTDLADQIDQADKRLFGGVLLIGGLVALINPVAGAAVAMKALLPSIGLVLSKFGLRYASEAANEAALASQIRAAERDVLEQFRGSDTHQVENPVLAQLDRALETSAETYDPVDHLDAHDSAFDERDRERLLTLTYRAIANVYEGIVDDPHRRAEASLGEEDVRWLRHVARLAASRS